MPFLNLNTFQHSLLYQAWHSRECFLGRLETLRSFGDQNDHDFIQSQLAGSNCFETKQCQILKQYSYDCFDCQRNARRVYAERYRFGRRNL